GLGDLSGVGYLAPGLEAAIARAGRSVVYWYVSMLAADVPPQLSKPDAIAQHCAASLDDLFRAVVRATQPADLRFDVLMDREPIDVWGRGRVTLLGDAAHQMLPHAGQGAAQALEDAVALGLVLAPARDPATSLRRYEMVRIVRTRRIVTLARQIAGTTTTRNPIVTRLRTAALRHAPASALLAALYPAGGADPHRELRTTQP
ncbi:MAG TPA: FAD-dependent monooxygenase, partial [Candidatus Eisenbacteria bacterium]|nr:FAD-dependent monooxygenase [Candidatus Eisenbacteria bacterium]